METNGSRSGMGGASSKLALPKLPCPNISPEFASVGPTPLSKIIQGCSNKDLEVVVRTICAESFIMMLEKRRHAAEWRLAGQAIEDFFVTVGIPRCVQVTVAIQLLDRILSDLIIEAWEDKALPDSVLEALKATIPGPKREPEAQTKAEQSSEPEPNTEPKPNAEA